MSIRQRLNRITVIPADYRSTTPPVPKSVKIEITQRCNYRCQYCAYTFRKDKPLDMDFELFKRITKEMVELGVEEFGVFYIGESFSNPKLLIDCVTYLKQDLKAPYVFLTSNASLAKPQVVKNLMAVGLDSLKWSCNATNDEDFNKLMGVNPTFFDLAKDNIKSAWELRQMLNYKTGLFTSSIMYDKNQPEKAKEFLAKYVLPYVDEHYWLPLYTMGGITTENSTKLGYQPLAGNPGRCDNLVPPIPCWTLFTGAHVLADGRLTGCCMDGLGNWVMGDLKTQSFMECWHSEEFKKLRQAHLNNNIIGTKCDKCALLGG